MAKDSTGNRRSRVPRAKAFTFVINQFLALAQEVYAEVGETPSIVTYWQCFFPEIRGRAYTRSDFEKQKGPAELLEVLRPNVDVMMGQEDLRALDNLKGDDLFGKACLVGWILRTVYGPYYELIASPLFDSFFGRDTLVAFRRLVAEDFRSPGFLFRELDSCLDDLTARIADARYGYTEPWPDHPARYAQYLLRKSQGPQALDLRADLATAMIMASLNGPRDYRPDLLIISRDLVVQTEQTTARERYAWSRARRPVDVGATRALLTQVTFPTEPADAREWMPCASPRIAKGKAGGGSETITYPLEGVDEILLVRSTKESDGGTSRFTQEGRTCIIPLDCPNVSTKHAKLVCEDDGWYLVDLDSTNGTLLVRVNEDRVSVCRKELAEIRSNHVKLENGDVICLAPDWANEQPLRDSPAFAFQLAASNW